MEEWRDGREGPLGPGNAGGQERRARKAVGGAHRKRRVKRR